MLISYLETFLIKRISHEDLVLLLLDLNKMITKSTA